MGAGTVGDGLCITTHTVAEEDGLAHIIEPGHEWLKHEQSRLLHPLGRYIPEDNSIRTTSKLQGENKKESRNRGDNRRKEYIIHVLKRPVKRVWTAGFGRRTHSTDDTAINRYYCAQRLDGDSGFRMAIPSGVLSRK